MLFGILTIVSCIILFYFAFTESKKEKYGIALTLIVIAGLLLRIYTSLDFFLHEWDERYHALVAKNLLENPFKPMLYSNPLLDYDFTNWTANHIWVHKQPVPLYSIALSMKLFGTNVLALRFPSILLSTMAIVATFKIGEFIKGKKIGLIAAFFCSINGLLIEQTAGRVATDHVDVFFFSLVSFSVWALLIHTKTHKKKHLFLGALFLAFAILTKWLPALIVMPIWLVFLYKRKKNKAILHDLFLLTTVTFILVAPWQWYIIQNFYQEAMWEFQDHRNHIFTVLGEHSHPWYYHFDRMRIIFGDLVYIPVLYLFYKLKSTPRMASALLIWIFIPYIFFSLVATKMQGYILFAAPAMFIMLGIFLCDVWTSKANLYLKYFTLLIFIALSARYTIERVKPFQDRAERTEMTPVLREIEKQYEGEKVVIFNTKFPIEIMFYTDIVAYYDNPPESKLEQLKAEGWFIIFDKSAWNDNVPLSKYPTIDLSSY